MKQKTCKICRCKFVPKNPLALVCDYKCSLTYANLHLKKSELKKERIKKKENQFKKLELKPKSFWLAKTQKVFNRYINLRDKGKPCISCNCKVEVPHASHYFSVGSAPNLRFNEENVHTSCVKCNLHLHGNISEYSIMLPKKIGEENFNKLISSRGVSKHYHIHELQELIKIYTEKIKNIK